MIHYVGWDLSQKITAICVVDEEAAGCGVTSCTLDPGQIERAAERHGTRPASASKPCPWRHGWVHELRGRGLDVTYLDVRRAWAALKRCASVEAGLHSARTLSI
jgi:transposase